MTEHSETARAVPMAAQESDAPLVPRFLSLVPQHAKRLDPALRSFGESALAETQARLQPATRDDFRRELTACLALTAPIGMSENDRNEWLRVAWGTLSEIPADLLAMGCTAARRRADHPAKIVPIIMDEADAILSQRRRNRSDVLAALGKMKEPEPEVEERCTPEQAAEILAKLGLKGEAGKLVRSHAGPPEKPTREWYLERGFDPDAKYEPIDTPLAPDGRG